MNVKRSLWAVLILLAALFALRPEPMPVYAACSHPTYTQIYSDASHPHRYFKYCNTCWAVFYTGGNEVKPHSVCSSCGTHSYVGQSCTSPGVCSCGATVGALGHVDSIYSDAAHPHARYRMCSRCYRTDYSIGGTVEKNHGDGSWGSGTCPSCGTHSYTGSGCVESCACGSTRTVHKFGNTQVYSDVEHTHGLGHQEYRFCTGGHYARQNTGTYATKPHGSGATGSGTCTDCGSHTYTAAILVPGNGHPHSDYYQCPCGSPSGRQYLNNGSFYWVTGTVSASHPHMRQDTCSVAGCGETNSVAQGGLRMGCTTCFPASSLTVRHYVDQGYSARYGGDPAAGIKLAQYNLTVNARFSELFNLHVTSSTSGYTTLPDICRGHIGGVTAENVLTLCGHTQDITTRFVLDDWKASVGNGTDTLSKVLWTGYMLLDGYEDGRSVTDVPDKVSIITLHVKTELVGDKYYNKNDAIVKKESEYQLMHELSHQLDLPDHYCYTQANNPNPCSNPDCYRHVLGLDDPPVCIMSTRPNITATPDNELYCQTCRLTMYMHLMHHR